MNLLVLDTATSSTVVCARAGAAPVQEARDDPPPDARPRHASRVLALCEEALARAGLSWTQLDRLGVGVGPGGFTGLRIGVATARALAQAHDLPLVPVSSLRALALGAPARDHPVAAVLDARRGEVFAAAWGACDARLLAPAALAPSELAERLGGLPAPALALGDGAVRFRAELVSAGARVPPDDSPLHRIGAAALCRAGAEGAVVWRDEVLPDYCREPDARPPEPPSPA